MSPQPHVGQSRTFYGIDTKIGYAQYVGELPMKHGDWVIYREATWPLQDYNFYKVVDVQEVYFMAKWGVGRKQPYCLHLQNHAGSKFWGCPEDYILTTTTQPSDAWGNPSVSPA
jgi:hypothetical protein